MRMKPDYTLLPWAALAQAACTACFFRHTEKKSGLRLNSSLMWKPDRKKTLAVVGTTQRLFH